MRWVSVTVGFFSRRLTNDQTRARVDSHRICGSRYVKRLVSRWRMRHLSERCCLRVFWWSRCFSYWGPLGSAWSCFLGCLREGWQPLILDVNRCFLHFMLVQRLSSKLYAIDFSQMANLSFDSLIRASQRLMTHPKCWAPLIFRIE